GSRPLRRGGARPPPAHVAPLDLPLGGRRVRRPPPGGAGRGGAPRAAGPVLRALGARPGRLVRPSGRPAAPGPARLVPARVPPGRRVGGAGRWVRRLPRPPRDVR